MGQDAALYDLAAKVPEGGVIVEIGSFKGKSTACLAAGCLGTTKTIYAIDPFTRQPTDEYNDSIWNYSIEDLQNNLQPFAMINYVVPVQGFSQEIGIGWDKQIDLLFIDGAHTYEGALSDFQLFFPWLKQGGLFALHDVMEVEKGSPWAGVWRVWAEEASPRLSDIRRVDTLACGVKL